MSEIKSVKDIIKDEHSKLDNDNLTNGKKEVKKTLEKTYSQIDKGTKIIKKISQGDEQYKMLLEQDRVARYYLERLGLA